MKIGYVYPFRAFPVKGGNHQHAYQLTRNFLQAGHEVYSLGDDSIAGVRSYSRDAAGAARLCEDADVLYVRLDGNRMGDDRLLVDLVEHSPIPIVWEINAPANESLAFSWLGGRTESRGFVSDIADRWKRRLHAWRQLPGIYREEKLRQRLAKRVHAAMCVSAALAEYARLGLGIGNAIVVPNGGDPETDRPDGPVAELPERFRDHLKVMYAGSPMYPWQGMDVVEATMRLCEAAGDPICFILLMNQAASRDMTANNSVVRIALPQPEVSHYTRAADVGLFLSPDFTWSRWGTHFSPIKIFEYMACGKPVIASRVGQLVEIVRPGVIGELFDNTPEDLRRCLLRVNQMRDRLPEMGRNARAAVESTYNWREVALHTMETLQSAIDHRSAT